MAVDLKHIHIITNLHIMCNTPRLEEYVYCIVLYCIMRPCTDGRLDRYRIGIPRELSEIRTQPWLSEGSLTCDPCHHRGPIF